MKLQNYGGRAVEVEETTDLNPPAAFPKGTDTGAENGTLTGAEKGALTGPRKGPTNRTPTGADTGTPIGAEKGTSTRTQTGSANGPSNRPPIAAATEGDNTKLVAAEDADAPCPCDGGLHGESLKTFDRDERLIDFALERAGLSTLLDDTQQWKIGDNVLTVSKWLVENGEFALRIWTPATDTASTVSVACGSSLPLPGSLDPAKLYAWTIAGHQFKPDPAEHAKWKLWLLIEADVVPARGPNLPDLPDDAHELAKPVWHAIRQLVAAERLCGGRPPGTPIMATPSFIARWTGLSEREARDGIRRLRALGYLILAGTVKLSDAPYEANLYRVAGDEISNAN